MATITTDLVIHHSVADIFNHATKLISILGAVQEPCHFASSCQWGEVSENVIQFPSNSRPSDWLPTLESVGLPFEGCPPLFLLNLTLRNRRT